MFKNHLGLKGQEDHLKLYDFRTLQTTFGWLFYCVKNKTVIPPSASEVKGSQKRGSGYAEEEIPLCTDA